MFMKAKILVGAAILASVLSPNYAAASDPLEGVYSVRHTAAELETPSGINRVLGDIHATAAKVCISELGAKRFLEKLEFQRCLKSVSSDLIEKIDNQDLFQANMRYNHHGDRKTASLK